jgi:ATP-binding cassette, subfamily G (WHITE), member 2, SNQ2
MANEFYDLTMECVAPYLVPQGPDASPQYQSCTLAGSQPGSTVIHGANYIQEAFSYSRSHLWRNFGFLWAFFIFFVGVTMVGMERMKPNAGGGAITVFKRGQVPKRIEQSIETGGRERKDEETAGGPTAHITEKMNDPNDTSATEEEEKSDEAMKNVGKNETIFTFQNINYTIPYEKGERKLLQDVQGYVRPGKLTALMGASGNAGGLPITFRIRY